MVTNDSNAQGHINPCQKTFKSKGNNHCRKKKELPYLFPNSPGVRGFLTLNDLLSIVVVPQEMQGRGSSQPETGKWKECYWLLNSGFHLGIHYWQEDWQASPVFLLAFQYSLYNTLIFWKVETLHLSVFKLHQFSMCGYQEMYTNMLQEELRKKYDN